MKSGTKVGCLLVAVSIIIAIWVLVGSGTEAEQVEEGGIRYQTSGDGTAYAEVYVGGGGAVTVLDVVNGCTVTEIKPGAFNGASGITSVTIPDTVVTIGDGAFRGCSSLGTISLGGGISNIPAEMFYGCSSLSSISLPGGVTNIGSNAFYGCQSLGSIAIPKATSSIASDAFSECSSLTNISVASGNSNFSSYEGCLYNGSGSRLILVPSGKSSVSIAPSTSVIGSGAFLGSHISTLVIPDGVATIESNAFNSELDTITIPASVTSMSAQGGWNPSVMYGYDGSAAEMYAIDAGIPFIVVGDDGEAEDEDPQEDDPQDDPQKEDPKKDDPQKEDPKKEDNGNSSTNVSPSGNTTTTGATGGSGTHVIKYSETSGKGAKDDTPKTADGDIDARWFLCMGVFLGGIAVVIYSNRRRLEYVSKKKDSDLDS